MMKAGLDRYLLNRNIDEILKSEKAARPPSAVRQPLGGRSMRNLDFVFNLQQNRFTTESFGCTC